MFAALRKRNFALLWIGQIVSLAGDYMLYVALPFYVFQLTGSVLQTGTMFVAETLPHILFGSFAGVFVDCWNRRWTMIVSDVSRAAVLLLLLFVHSQNLLWLVYVVTILQATVSQFFTPAVGALTPLLVDEQQLLAANSLESFSDSVTRFVGPPLGGVLFSLFGLVSIVYADSATFLFSALMIILIVVPKRVAEKQGDATPRVASIWREWLDGLQLVYKDSILSGIFLTMSVFMVGQGLINVLIVPFVERVLHSSIVVWSFAMTAQGIGSLIGALLMGWASKFLKPIYLILLPLGIGGVVILVIVNVPIVAVLLTLIALVGVFIVGFLVSIQTILQQSVADLYRGRVLGAFNATIYVAMMLGLVIATALGDRLGIVPLFDAVGVIFFLSGAVALLTLRNAKIIIEKPAVPDVGV